MFLPEQRPVLRQAAATAANKTLVGEVGQAAAAAVNATLGALNVTKPALRRLLADQPPAAAGAAGKPWVPAGKAPAPPAGKVGPKAPHGFWNPTLEEQGRGVQEGSPRMSGLAKLGLSALRAVFHRACLWSKPWINWELAKLQAVVAAVSHRW